MTVQSRRRTKTVSRPLAVAANENAFSFETTLAWIGIAHVEHMITEIKFGYQTDSQLRASFDRPKSTLKWRHRDELDDFERELNSRFAQFAAGDVVDFEDVDIDCSAMTPFQRCVTDACRAIPYGQTLSYAELANQAGSPRAARAVGSVMSNNRFPLIVPCHRVVSVGGRLGGFSAPTGVNLKLKLLQLEGAIDFVTAEHSYA